MKTYSRRKTQSSVEAEEIVDLEDVCRLCMDKENTLISIFNNDEAVSLTLKIMACVALEVFEDDGLPDKICHACKFQLEKSYNFRKKCEHSDMKLRMHFRDIKQELGDVLSDDNESNTPESQNDDSMRVDAAEDELSQASGENFEQAKDLSTEEDLVGVTKVSYMQGPEEDQENENVPSDITLPLETDNLDKEACTFESTVSSSTVEMKNELKDSDADQRVFIIEENEAMEDADMGAIADAVKATLANQPGININGQIQLKVNSSRGKTTEVEVSTEDGHFIVMEIMTEDETNKSDIENVPEDKNEEGELKVFKCPDCPKSFARRIQLKRHASVHMQQRGFSCGICEKWFPIRSSLVRHERIHTGERPFQCEVCFRSFTQKGVLFRHLMIHTGQRRHRPYTCSSCPRDFNQKEQLRLHLETHTNPYPEDMVLHYCTLCPRVFCHASGLSRHLVTHGGKFFWRSDCDKAFTDKSSLRRHHTQTGHQA